jgi:excisionase family DNA binding protein
MPHVIPPPTTSETATLVRLIMSKLGQDGSITVGNPATGESCALPPHIADLIRQVLNSLAEGRQVTIAENLSEMTPNEAAAFLNVSRMYVMKLIHDGVLPHRMVGNHHRIPYADLAAYRTQEKAQQRIALDRIYELDREMGLDQLDGPAPDTDTYRGTGPR